MTTAALAVAVALKGAALFGYLILAGLLLAVAFGLAERAVVALKTRLR